MLFSSVREKSRHITSSSRIFPFAAMLAIACFVRIPSLSADPTVPVYRDVNASVDARVNDLYNHLTEDDKLKLMMGTNFSTEPIERLGIPEVLFADAGQGVRGGLPPTHGPATAFPAEVTMASSWDRSLVSKVGAAIGNEAKNKGAGVQLELGPAVNIHRSPLCGRDSEYMGEDPYLTANLAVAYIDGMQGVGTLACIKHFACNNEEYDRGYVDVKVGERALREIYLPSFEAAIKTAHVASIMAAYNKVNGPYCAANWYLLHNVLRTGWGFNGLAMSDWGAVHEIDGVVNAGLDLEMPGPGLLSQADLQRELDAHRISQSSIDLAVKHILRAMVLSGVVNPVQYVPDNKVVGSTQSQQVANQAALEGMILLKNRGGILPLNPNAAQKIVIIGPRAKAWQIDSYGSPQVEPTVQTNAYDGIVKRLSGNPGVTISYYPGDPGQGQPIPTNVLTAADGTTPGLTGEYFANRDLTGTGGAARVDPAIDFIYSGKNRPAGIPEDDFSVRWTGTVTAPETGDYQFNVRSDDGCRLWIGDKQLIDDWNEQGATTEAGHIRLVAGQKYPVKLEYFQHQGDATVTFGWAPPSYLARSYKEASDAAKAADVAIVIVGSETETEGTDRKSMGLPDQQDVLIKTIAAANPHTIVVTNNGGPVQMHNWIDSVPAVLDAGFPGETGGDALASILFGDVSPSGKLVDTVGMKREDYPDYGHFPGVKGTVRYVEGVYVGYRAFDKRKITPQFPFGYGLSYTKFRYSNLTISKPKWDTSAPLIATAKITNVGSREGAEVAELYIQPRSPLIDRPIQELKGFDRVDLLPGQSKTVVFPLNQRSFAYCDVPGKQWRADKGKYIVNVGASSRDIRLAEPIVLTKTWIETIPGLGAKDPFTPEPNLAKDEPASASSTVSGNIPSFAFDEDYDSRWESAPSDPQWLEVDLTKSATFSKVEIAWEVAYASAYQIQVSSDNVNWTTVYSTTTSLGGDDIDVFTPVTARYVRVFCRQRGSKFAYSIKEVKVTK